MAFRGIPTLIKDPQADAKAINDNFDETHSDLIDMGGLLSTTASTGALATDPTTPPFTKVRSVSVGVINNDPSARAIYEPNRTPIIPRVAVYVDNDLDSGYLWPSGGSLTESQKFTDVEVVIDAGTESLSGNTVAKFYIRVVNNSGVDAHTYYVYVNTFVYPSPDTSRFNS